MGRGITTTKFEIVQVASEFFFEVGNSKTSPNMIAKELGISTGTHAQNDIKNSSENLNTYNAESVRMNSADAKEE